VTGPRPQSHHPSQSPDPCWVPARLVVGEGALDGRPERRCVLRMGDEGEFVDEHVVDRGGRQLEGRPVDVEPAVAAEGAPPVARSRASRDDGCKSIRSARGRNRLCSHCRPRSRCHPTRAVRACRTTTRATFSAISSGRPSTRVSSDTLTASPSRSRVSHTRSKWGGRDSNPRPRDYESPALTG
jgi:hypothetical protein